MLGFFLSSNALIKEFQKNQTNIFLWEFFIFLAHEVLQYIDSADLK